MTLPTTEALREAVERVRGPSQLHEMEEALGTRCAVPKADIRTLLEAADLLLSEEWQGMVEAAKGWDLAKKGDFDAIQSRQELQLKHAARSLARKLAAQEETPQPGPEHEPGLGWKLSPEARKEIENMEAQNAINVAKLLRAWP